MEYKVYLKDADKQIVLIMVDGVHHTANKDVTILKNLELDPTRGKGWWVAEVKIPTRLVVDVWEKKFPHGEAESELVESFRSGDKREPKSAEQLEKLTWNIESK